jgi:hypothetical protein
MQVASLGKLADSARPWLSLWITIHFFAICICLAANISPSEMERRVVKIMAPYAVGLHQDYGGVPLEMTRGGEIDFQHVFEVHETEAQPNVWLPILPGVHVGSWADYRWSAFQRMVAAAASEKNEDLIHLLLERAVAHHRRTTDKQVDVVRLMRRTALSYAADQALIAGDLPSAELADSNLYECRVVRLGTGQTRLLPVLESTRTTKSVNEQSSETRP